MAMAKRIAALGKRMRTSQSSRSAALAKTIAAQGTRMQLGILNFPVPQLSSCISIKLKNSLLENQKRTNAPLLFRKVYARQNKLHLGS